MQTFQIGDRVKALAFTDCFNKDHAEVSGLTVTHVRHIPAQHGVAEYWRICAEREDHSYIEAAERFFTMDACCDGVGFHSSNCPVVRDGAQ